MAILQALLSPVKPMTEVIPALKRGIGIHNAVLELAKWDCDRRGVRFVSLKALPIDDQASYRIAAERMIEAFEVAAFDKQPEGRARSQETERDAFILMERQRAKLEADNLGHALGGWYPVEDRHDQTASCVRCKRVACLIVTYDPELQIRREGTALSEGCLVVAGTEVR